MPFTRVYSSGTSFWNIGRPISGGKSDYIYFYLQENYILLNKSQQLNIFCQQMSRKYR